MAKSQLQTDLKHEIKLGRQPWHPAYVCTWCERFMDAPGTASLTEATKDHPHPKSMGGGHVTVWSCYTCNHIKANMPYQAWRLYMEMNPRWYLRQLTREGQKLFQPGVKIEEQEDNNNVVPLRKQMLQNFQVIAGGQPPTSGNWLMDLKIGTKFTVRSKTDTKNFMCLDLEIVNKTLRTVMLYEMSTGAPFGGNGRVDPQRFVLLFDKVEELSSYEDMLNDLPQVQEETTTETTDGNCDRSSEPDAK